jgi:hypothetical protein
MTCADEAGELTAKLLKLGLTGIAGAHESTNIFWRYVVGTPKPASVAPCANRAGKLCYESHDRSEGDEARKHNLIFPRCGGCSASLLDIRNL